MMPAHEVPRGIRNNNPLNIRHSRDEWLGMSPVQRDSDFVQFVSPLYGIRAAAENLINYQRRDGCDTLAKIVYRHAPPVENNTDAYLNAVTGALGIDADKVIDLARDGLLRPLIVAMTRQENVGQQPYDLPTLLGGIKLALDSLGIAATATDTTA